MLLATDTTIAVRKHYPHYTRWHGDDDLGTGVAQSMLRKHLPALCLLRHD
jgi:hypothetical protein